MHTCASATRWCSSLRACAMYGLQGAIRLPREFQKPCEETRHNLQNNHNLPTAQNLSEVLSRRDSGRSTSAVVHSSTVFDCVKEPHEWRLLKTGVPDLHPASHIFRANTHADVAFREDFPNTFRPWLELKSSGISPWKL